MLAHHIISSGRLLARNDLERVLRRLPRGTRFRNADFVFGQSSVARALLQWHHNLAFKSITTLLSSCR